MHLCAADVPPGTDALREAGLTARPGRAIAAPVVVEAPAAFECRRLTTLEFGPSRQIVRGEILDAHDRDGVVDPDTLRVDPALLDAIARLGRRGGAATARSCQGTRGGVTDPLILRKIRESGRWLA